MNLKIKFRESFRPFAPSVLEERVSEFFALDRASPYMLLVAPVQESHRRTLSDEERSQSGIDKLRVQRSDIPAVTHVDATARVQTVRRDDHPLYYDLLKRFEEKTGWAVIINTSFNVRGEPIVCSPEDAYRCFLRTEMDYLVMGSYLLAKSDQPAVERDESWKEEFALD
jgi:carbamoyltransferase